MPVDVNIQFIEKENDVALMEVLVGKKYVGVDSEWRPQIHSWHKTKGLALLQIGSDTDVFLICMVNLRASKVLDKMLSKIFNHPSTTICGFSFKSDIAELKKQCPSL